MVYNSLFATRYGFIDKGTIVKEATQEEIRLETEENCYIESDNIEKAQSVLIQLGYEPVPSEKGLRIHKDIDLMRVCAAFSENGIRLTKHICSSIDLETYFMNLIGGGHNEPDKS